MPVLLAHLLLIVLFITKEQREHTFCMTAVVLS